MQYEAVVRNVAYWYVRDHGAAEDVAQETFLIAARRATAFRGDGTVRSWLLRIAVRRALDELRRRARKSEVALTEHAPESTRPHEGLHVKWELDDALSTLAPEKRAALVLREVEGLSYREISEALGWPIGTVGTQLHRARMELRDALEKDGPHGRS